MYIYIYIYIVLLHYCLMNEINPRRCGSYIDSPNCIKKATINPIYKDHNKCFQYLVTVALNHGEIKKDLQRMITIKPFINK